MINTKKLIDNICYAIKKTIYEDKTVYQDNAFKIVTYDKQKENDALFINKHKQEIYDFLDAGYKAENLEGFKSCSNAKHLARNCNEIKIAYHKDTPIAISVYTGYLNGFKCVGITATTDINLHKLGVMAVHEIIKADIKLYGSFYWCECSGKIEKLYAKYNGIAIPSAYLSCFFKTMPKVEYDPDGFHYIRNVGGDDVKKIIFGFNSKTTFDAIYKDYAQYILDAMKQIDNNINESVNIDIENADKNWSKITVFHEAWMAGFNEHPQEALDILQDAVEKLENIIEKHSDKFSEDNLHLYQMAVENGREILKTASVLTYHLFE